MRASNARCSNQHNCAQLRANEAPSESLVHALQEFLGCSLVRTRADLSSPEAYSVKWVHSVTSNAEGQLQVATGWLVLVLLLLLFCTLLALLHVYACSRLRII
jgi:hypothetical protein